MKVAVRFPSPQEEEKALPILLRHSPGMILQGPTYVLSQYAVDAIRAAGVVFTSVANEGSVQGVEPAGERV